VRCIARNANYKSREPIFRLREIKQEELCASKTNAAAGFCFNFRITKARTCIYIIWSGLNILKQCICASTPRQSDFPSFSRNVRGGGGGAHRVRKPHRFVSQGGRGRGIAAIVMSKNRMVEIWSAAQIAAGPFVINMSP
jgi:hypothetical protein